MMPQMVLFQTGNMHFVIRQNCMDIIDPHTSEATARRESNERQTIAYNGRSCLLVDLAAALGPDVVHPRGEDAKIIVFKEASIALWADRIEDSLSAEAEDMAALPGLFTSSAGACFSRVLKLKDHLALVVDSAVVEKLEKMLAPSVSRNGSRPKSPARASKPGPDADSCSSPALSDHHALEGIVVDKLKRFIGRRVKQALARTIAETLDQHRVRI